MRSPEQADFTPEELRKETTSSPLPPGKFAYLRGNGTDFHEEEPAEEETAVPLTTILSEIYRPVRQQFPKADTAQRELANVVRKAFNS